MVFEGSRLVFHDYRWNVLVSYGPRKFLRLVMVPCRCFMIPGWFLWFFIVSGWFKSELDLYLGPTIPLGLVGRRPALAF